MADLEADAEQDLPPSSPGPSRAVSAQRQTFTYQSMREETTSIILATDKPVSNPKSAFHFQPEVPTKPLTAVRAAPAVLRPSVPSPPRISNIPPNPRKLPAAHPVPREQEEDLANQLFPPTPPRISAQAKGKARAAPEPHSRDNRGFQGAWQSTSHPPTRSTARQSTAQIVELDEDDIHEDDWQDENESGANVNAEDDDEEIEIIAPQASSAKNGKSRQTAQNASLSTNRRGDLSPPTGSIFVSKLPSPIRNGCKRSRLLVPRRFGLFAKFLFYCNVRLSHGRPGRRWYLRHRFHRRARSQLQASTRSEAQQRLGQGAPAGQGEADL